MLGPVYVNVWLTPWASGAVHENGASPPRPKADTTATVMLPICIKKRIPALLAYMPLP
eukprot:COSAG03_NODE_16205_length_408_cov_3.469256_2_plen_57_part_01